MNCNISSVHAAHPEWFNVNGRGESSWERPIYIPSYRFLCPSRPEVDAFLQQRIQELSDIDELDGIHLDVIRQQDVILAEGLQIKHGIEQSRELPENDYCYCEVCRAGFRELYGIDPLDLADPAASTDWRQYRYNLITRIVNDVIVPVGRAKGKEMTAAVFDNWEHVRQQWSRWDIDGLHPMLYHTFYLKDVDWIVQRTRAGIESLSKPIPLYAGLFVDDLNPEEFEGAVRGSMKSGASGVALHSTATMSDRHWAVLRSLTRTS